MRSRRQGEVAIIGHKGQHHQRPHARKNMRALTPPKNKMPMAMMTITKKAPMSGSASSSTPTISTANAMGSTARKKRSFTAMRRTM